MAIKNTKEALLEKGFELFHQQGYHATGISEITDAVNVSKGSFYNHFKKKEKFVVVMIDNFGKQIAWEHQVALTNKKNSPLNRIKNFYRSKAKTVIEISKYKKGCFVSNMCQEVADNSQTIASSVDEAFEGMRKALTVCLEEAKTEEEIKPDTDAKQLAEFILNSWNGALMRVKASQNSNALNAFLNYLENL